MRSVIYTPKELLELIIRASDIREGHWELSLAYDIKAGYTAEAPEALHLPTVFFRLGQIGLVEKAEPTAASVDASKLT